MLLLSISWNPLVWRIWLITSATFMSSFVTWLQSKLIKIISLAWADFPWDCQRAFACFLPPVLTQSLFTFYSLCVLTVNSFILSLNPAARSHACGSKAKLLRARQGQPRLSISKILLMWKKNSCVDVFHWVLTRNLSGYHIDYVLICSFKQWRK